MGEAQANEGGVESKGLEELPQYRPFEVAELKVEGVDPVVLAPGLLGSEHLADVTHGLGGDFGVDRAQGVDVGLDFEVGAEGGCHFGVLPVHLRVVQLAVDPHRVEEGLQPHLVKEKGIAAEA